MAKWRSLFRWIPRRSEKWNGRNGLFCQEGEIYGTMAGWTLPRTRSILVTSTDFFRFKLWESWCVVFFLCCKMHRWANGDIYIGDWRQGNMLFKVMLLVWFPFFSNVGRPHGHGEFRHAARGTKFVGQFVKGQKSGFGTEYYKDNSSFMGRFRVALNLKFFLSRSWTWNIPEW